MTGSDDSSRTLPDTPVSFRLAYVPGTTPAKWVRIWSERLPDVPLSLIAVSAADATGALRDRTADAGLVRLPADPAGRTDLGAIPLYTEISVVLAPKDHVVNAADEVTTDDLADDVVLHPLDDTLEWERLPGLPAVERPATTADAVELVAAGVGLLVVPQSLARLHHRKDLTYRPVSDAPQSRVALSWPTDATTELVEEFIGIVRGRTVNSSRGRAPSPPQPPRKSAASGTGQRAKSTGRAAKPARSGSRAAKPPGRGRPRRGS